MRCLALAQAWQDDGGEAVFAMAKSTPAVRARLAHEGHRVISNPVVAGSTQDANWTADLASQHSAKWTVADGYSFDADYQRRIKDAGLKLLGIDDHASVSHLFADLVVNQNLHAHQVSYLREPCTQLLLGPKFAMLRREFEAWRGWRRDIPAIAKRVLVTMGGSDPGNLSAIVIEALRLLSVEGLEAVVVVGGSNPHIASLRSQTAGLPEMLKLEVDVRNIPELMSWADIAVSAAGATVWEMCMLGLPAIITAVADNQVPIAEELYKRDLGIYIPQSRLTVQNLAEKIEFMTRSASLRSNMSQSAVELVDGRGASRVLAAMKFDQLSLRQARPADCHLVWEWANDALVRQVSFSNETISWGDHCQWFSQRIEDPAVLFLICEEAGTAVGTVRFEKDGNSDAAISMSIAQKYRGRGLAALFIKKAAALLFERGQIKRVHAFVRENNRASVRSFESAGFFRIGAMLVRGTEALHYVLEKSTIAYEPLGRAEAEAVR